MDQCIRQTHALLIPLRQMSNDTALHIGQPALFHDHVHRSRIVGRRSPLSWARILDTPVPAYRGAADCFPACTDATPHVGRLRKNIKSRHPHRPAGAGMKPDRIA